MANWLILLTLFVSEGARGQEIGHRIATPDYCQQLERERVEVYRNWKEFECRGIAAFNSGHYRVASIWLQYLNDIRFHEAPNLGRFTLQALAFARADEKERAVAAMDLAYGVILISAGYVRCDLEGGLFIKENNHTTALGYDILGFLERRMCGSMFYDPDHPNQEGSYGKGTLKDLARPVLRATEYEKVRSILGFGHPLPTEK